MARKSKIKPTGRDRGPSLFPNPPALPPQSHSPYFLPFHHLRAYVLAWRFITDSGPPSLTAPPSHHDFNIADPGSMTQWVVPHRIQMHVFSVARWSFKTTTDANKRSSEERLVRG